MEYLRWMLSGYVPGCINPAYILGRLKGFDIREQGSKNAGASNAAVTMGYGAAVICAVFDILKAFIPAFVCGRVFGGPVFIAVSGVSSVMGHIFPVTLKFKGGKGLACFMGMILAFSPAYFAVFGAGLIVITVATNYIALGTVAVSVCFPAYLFLSGDTAAAAVVSLATIIMLFKHIINIKRIFKGEEIGLRSVQRRL